MTKESPQQARWGDLLRFLTQEIWRRNCSIGRIGDYFESWITFVEEAYNKELDTIEVFEIEVKLASMTIEEKGRAEKFYAILVGHLRNRPLKLLWAVEGRNGYEVWRQLSLQLAPKTRSRSIALLQAFLNHPNFTKDAGTAAWSRKVG